MSEFSFSVAEIFGDNMVLQQGKNIKIWGTSQKAQTIRVFINGCDVGSTQANPWGWIVFLPPMEVARNLVMEIAGEDPAEKFVYQNVAVGEVWLAGGQSNMEFLLAWDAEAEKVIPNANDPDIRFYDCPKIKFEGQEEEDDLSQFGFWRPCDPDNVPFFSAVGYYFAEKLYTRYQVPIGIVGCNWGGTTAATWMDESYLRYDEKLSIYIQEYEDGLKELDMAQYLQDEKKARELMQQSMAKQVMNTIMKRTPRILLRLFITILMKASMKKQATLGLRSENRPGGLFHTMLERIAPYSMRGVLWYQGEADDVKAELYARLFSTMIRCWRETWGEDFPFLFVQLAPYERWLAVPAQNFVLLREQQALVSKTVADAHMVSIMDVGDRDDIHPKHKRPVGERLALLARGKVYGEDILCEAPEAASVRLEDGGLVIPFNHAGDGLTVKGKQLKSLELIADGRVVKPKQVSVEKSAIKVKADRLQAAKVLEVRFAYRNFAEVNLYNSAGLPAKPFRLRVEMTS